MNCCIEEKDFRTISKKVALSRVSAWTFLSLISSAFAIYYLCIGIFVDVEAFLYAFAVIMADALFLFLTIRNYIEIKTECDMALEAASENGVIEYNVDFEKNVCKIERLTNRKETQITNKQITSIQFTKKLILIRVDSAYTIALPSTKELKCACRKFQRLKY